MGSGSTGMICPISVPLPTQPWNVPRWKEPGSCREGTGCFKAAFVSIRSQVQPGEQRFPNLRAPLREPHQLVLRLAPAGWVAPVSLGLLSCKMEMQWLDAPISKALIGANGLGIYDAGWFPLRGCSDVLGGSLRRFPSGVIYYQSFRGIPCDAPSPSL